MNDKSKQDSKPSLRITQQSHARTGMAYEFRCDGTKLIVRVYPSDSPADSGEWRVEARTSNAPEALVVTEWGATKTEALAEVGRSWGPKAKARGLPAFDWDAVAQALAAVRAL